MRKLILSAAVLAPGAVPLRPAPRRRPSTLAWAARLTLVKILTVIVAPGLEGGADALL